MASRIPSRIVCGWILCIGIIPTFIFAQEIPILKKIQVQSTDNSEQLVFIFDKEYIDEPIINFDPGALNLHFTNALPAPDLPKVLHLNNHPHIRFIRINRGHDSIPLNIIFHSRNLVVGGKFSVKKDNGQLYLAFDKKALEKIDELPEAPLFSDNFQEELNEKTLKTDDFPATFSRQQNSNTPENTAQNPDILPQPQTDAMNQNWVEMLLVLIMSLLIVLLAIYLLSYVYNRFLAGRIGSLPGKIQLKVVSTFHIGSRQKILILEVNQHQFACGVTPMAINFLTEINGEQDRRLFEKVASSSQTIDTDQARAQFMGVLESARRQSKQQRAVMQEVKIENSSRFHESMSSHESTSSNEQKFEKGETPQKTQKTTKVTSFQTPVAPPTETLEDQIKGDPNMQQFAKNLSKKLKSLKPLH